ncbi:MAG: DUF6089 family protein [Bacteroidales bacterium]|nr:DUF6089 family protein [Bacteroidales bacterium]
MKKNSLHKLILVALMIPLGLSSSHGQGTRLEDFSLKLSPGTLSYFGDITNDMNASSRFSDNSKFAFGVSLTQQYAPCFGLQAQFMTGNLHKTSDINTYYTGSVNEFSLSARFDPLRIWKQRSLTLSPYITGGIGVFTYKGLVRYVDNDQAALDTYGYNYSGVKNNPKGTALAFPVAIGLSYSILPNLQIELEHCMRFTNTDFLDCKGSGSSNDSYSSTSIGLRFSFPSKGNDARSTKTKKTKATTAPVEIKKAADKEVNVFIDCEMPETSVAGQSYDVNIRLNKGSYTGPGKLIQKYPEGFTATKNVDDNYAFSFNNQMAVIEWAQMPADSVISLSYKAKTSETLTGSQTITGRFEYQDFEGAKTVRFNQSVFVDAPKKEADEDADVYTKSNIKQAKAIPGIEFRVQIGAFRNNSQADTDLAAKYRISEVIQEEFTGGWYKYTIGSFKTYEQAVSYRDKFIARSKMPSAFIVAYRDGKRLAKISDALK